jgi:hypothetical protein
VAADWVQCDACAKWRVLPAEGPAEVPAGAWVCAMNRWDLRFAACDAPEEEERPSHGDLAEGTSPLLLPLSSSGDLPAGGEDFAAAEAAPAAAAAPAVARVWPPRACFAAFRDLAPGGVGGSASSFAAALAPGDAATATAALRRALASAELQAALLQHLAAAADAASFVDCALVAAAARHCDGADAAVLNGATAAPFGGGDGGGSLLGQVFFLGVVLQRSL